MDTVFRVATAGDEAAIRRLFVALLRTIFHTQEVEGYPAGYVGRFFTGGEDEILVAEQAGMVVGFLSLESHREGEPPFLYLDDFSVAAACRGQGIGSRLLDMAEEYAAAIGLDKKGAGADISVILLEEMGRAIPHKMPKAALLEELK